MSGEKSVVVPDGVQRPGLAKHDSSVLDLAFVMDCTGSMASYIEQARKNIRAIVEEIVSKEKSDIRMALIEYRDHPPQDSSFVTRPHDFTGSVSTMKKWLDACSATGGGDTPEAVADGLYQLLKLSWREQSTKICVFIADAPPHGLSQNGDSFPNGCPDNIDPMDVGRQLAQKGVTVYMVGCEPSICPYKDFFMALAHMTGGQYVPLRGAHLLTRVIIGGAQEELSLDQWMADVEAEVVQELQQRGDEDFDEAHEEVVSRRVHEQLKKKGAMSKQLRRNKEALASAPKSAQALSNCLNMADVRKNFKMDTSAAAAPMAVPVPGRFRLRGGGYGPPPGDAAMSAPVEDCYETAETEIAFEQAERMVKKAVWRNKHK